MHLITLYTLCTYAGFKGIGDTTIPKGKASIQEIVDHTLDRYIAVMFCKNVNMTDSKTNKTTKDVSALTIGTCALTTSGCSMLSGKELNSTIIFQNNTLMKLHLNSISMTYYALAQSQANVPLFVTTFITLNSNNNANELWILYCFTLFCQSKNKLYYKIRSSSNQLSYPVIAIDSDTRPSIVYFENSTSLMYISCQDSSYKWNCTLPSNVIITRLKNNTNYVTSSMQISFSTSPSTLNAVILFSMVVNPGIFNGSFLISCSSATCYFHQGSLIDNDSNTDKFSTSFDITVFVINSWIISFIIIIGIFAMYKFIPATNFISKNIRNAYLTKVSLDPSRIRPLTYWFFFAILICSAMCIVPWFAYFDYDMKTYSFMILPAFFPVIITLLLVLILHICRLQQNLCKILIIISILYWLSTLALSYSFSLVWKLKSDNCQISDLSGLKIVILVGHISTVCVVIYLLFWCIKCFQALKLASPEKLRNIYSDRANNKNYFNALSGQNNKIIPNSRLLQALHDGKMTPTN